MASFCRAHDAGSALSASTPILMTDGRVRALSDVEPGDRVYGTRIDRRRRYTEAVVADKRATIERAYEIGLADGTKLVVGPDLRLLTYRSWKHITGAEQGHRRRPHLTPRASLLGTGHFTASLAGSRSYRRGYLCGLIRGDGHVGSYRCTPVGKPPWIKHGFRLALADSEALDRARSYLTEAGIELSEFVFQRATATRRAIAALGNQTRDGVDGVRHIINWPRTPDDGWRAGFLAGIFDAEGSCGGREALRISNTAAAILDCTEASLRHFGFDVVRETTTRPNGMAYIRLRGGLKERLRFFHMTDPAITRKRTALGLGLQSDADLRVMSIEPLDVRLPLCGMVTSTGDLIADGVVVGAGYPPTRPRTERAQ